MQRLDVAGFNAWSAYVAAFPLSSPQPCCRMHMRWCATNKSPNENACEPESTSYSSMPPFFASLAFCSDLNGTFLAQFQTHSVLMRTDSDSSVFLAGLLQQFHLMKSELCQRK